jgi:alpha-beta hydrolase superfamily lysophospholipase
MKTPALALTLLAALPACMPPSWGANALLHPPRSTRAAQPALPFEDFTWPGAGVDLRGWKFHTLAHPPRGTLVYLHGVADNRASSVGIASHFVPQGYDVVAYDSRAHGQSTGDACTYGFYEKTDLARVIDHVGPGPVVVMGTSLGGAVALQGAAVDHRIAAVIAIAPFSDLRTAALERAPFFASRGNIEEAFRLAEDQGHFRVAEASPLAAAPGITIPVLLIHGDHDTETPYDHSVRLLPALAGPKRLITVKGGGHRQGLGPDTWAELDAWLDQALTPASGADKVK